MSEYLRFPIESIGIFIITYTCFHFPHGLSKWDLIPRMKLQETLMGSEPNSVHLYCRILKK